MLKLQEIDLKLGRTKVLLQLNLEVMEREVYGLVGPLGSGKSSLCRVVAGVWRPDHGNVLLYGKSIYQDESYKWDIGYVPDDVEMYHYQQVLEYLVFFGELYGMKKKEAFNRAEKILELIHLAGMGEDYLRNLSKGAKQKLLIGRALMHRPKFLVLDDLMTGLDPVSRVELQSILLELKESGVSVLVTSDDLNSVSRFCDKIAIIDAGRIAATGTVEEILHLKQSSNPIVIHVRDSVEEAVNYLRNHTKVSSLSRKENYISVWYSGQEGEEAELLTGLIELGIPVCAFHREESDFDSLYLRITKR